jgi:hypothetical protein
LDLEAMSPWANFNLDVSPDGRRFAAVRKSAAGGSSIFFVKNWAAELPDRK